MVCFFFSSRRRHTRWNCDWSSDVCSSDLHFLARPGADPGHLFACLFQIRRAFHHIFWHVVGGSMSMARLRAAVWQSVFTHDMRRYRRALYERMDDVTTLIVGPSGTGKEVVARAIGLSRYIPFDQ